MNKGQIAGEGIFYFIYLTITLLLFAGIHYIPDLVLNANLDTHDLENQIYNERIFNLVSETDLYTKRVLQGTINTFENDLLNDAFSEEKKIAFKISLNGEQIYFNQNFYEYAAPLAPIRYKIFRQERNVNYKVPRTLKIEQVYDDEE
ncbi:hypothetical protein COV11_04610 [Candidatus Woesearchaeota archaeon CG10_big_fil_rev_8_21_14_0_10_30_7]|nr:MAG: hypothetical protein COV11_04610 [Candidatus Woesearchaeota archaeon CG10_big_fil_rev_8_21_14_0_10_30_7]